MFSHEITQYAEQIIDKYSQRGRKIATAESCTGGLIAGALTEVSGSSAVFERGFITYSNEAKHEVLGVLPQIIKAKGAVSAEVAEEMAKGALVFSSADVAVSATGIAGPTGGSTSKPVGLVYIGMATREGTSFHYKCSFNGARKAVRLHAVEEALKLLLTVEDN